MSRATDLIHSDDTLPETDVPLCMKGSLQAAYEKAQRDLEEAETRPARGRRLAEGDPTRVLRERLDDLAEQMQPYILAVRLRALERPAFRKLRAAHPPRQDDGKVMDVDLAVGVNIETFFDALLRASVLGAVDGEDVEPISDSDVDMLLEKRISDGQWKTLADSAWSINRRDVDVPFLPSSLLPTRNS